jgi:hypothetical protein
VLPAQQAHGLAPQRHRQLQALLEHQGAAAGSGLPRARSNLRVQLARLPGAAASKEAELVLRRQEEMEKGGSKQSWRRRGGDGVCVCVWVCGVEEGGGEGGKDF